MSTLPNPNGSMLSIAAVERDTGLGKDTLRVWERRYGFPVPGRDAFGERSYPFDQVEKLRVIRRLMDQGHRPGRIVSQPLETLLTLGPAPVGEELGEMVIPEHVVVHFGLIKSHDSEALQALLAQDMAREGLTDFVTDIVTPLLMCVGEAWARGDLAIFEEHLFTECVIRVMRLGIMTCTVPRHKLGPRVLLTTFPQEPHGLGLLMVECVLVEQGCTCLSLGTKTPVLDIAFGAVAHRVDVVALSFSSLIKPNDVVEGLQELRRHLTDAVSVWAGGQALALRRRKIPQVDILGGFADIPLEVNRWRNAALKLKR